jgi:hypothetical protein
MQMETANKNRNPKSRFKVLYKKDWSMTKKVLLQSMKKKCEREFFLGLIMVHRKEMKKRDYGTVLCCNPIGAL